MLDVLGLCRLVRNKFPEPTAPKDIFAFVKEHVGMPSADVRKYISKALSAEWKRRGWTWDDAGAVKLEPEEEALFHHAGVSIIKSAGEEFPDKVIVFPIQTGDAHPKVVWFK